jgi:ABC-2 type transport system permease protein
MGWTIGLVAMVTMVISVYPTVRSSASALSAFVANYPEVLRRIFRLSDYTSGPGYLSSELLSFMAPLMFIAVGVSWGGTTTAQEEEHRTTDLLLTLPISRTKILVTKICAAVVAQVVLAGVLFLALLLGVHFVHLSIGSSKIAAASLSCAFLGIIYNAVGTFFGAAAGKKSISVGGAIALAFTGFIFYSLTPTVSTFNRIKLINPFQWTLGSEPLTHGLDILHISLRILAAIVLFSASTFLFGKRDIRA